MIPAAKKGVEKRSQPPAERDGVEEQRFEPYLNKEHYTRSENIRESRNNCHRVRNGIMRFKGTTRNVVMSTEEQPPLFSLTSLISSEASGENNNISRCKLVYINQTIQ